MRSLTHRLVGLMPIVLAAGLLLQLQSAKADSVPFWGAKASVSIDTPIDKLKKKGEFLWLGNAFTSGPVVMVVSLTEQRAYAATEFSLVRPRSARGGPGT